MIRDRRRIADLYLQGWTQARIAEVVGVSQMTISNDLKALHEEWRQSSLVDIDAAKAKELAKLDRLEREYWDGWVASCEKGVKVTKTKKVGDETITITQQVEAPIGDPRFLAGVLECIERRCKQMGIDAPKRVDHRIVNLAQMNLTEEQIDRLAAGEPMEDVLSGSDTSAGASLAIAAPPEESEELA